MMEGVVYTGVPSQAELAACPGIPSEERMRKGRVACIECVQEIPCNPCEGICHFGAITVGEQITNLPCLDEKACTGCGLCVAHCPGLAITIIDKSYSETEATVDFPFEYIPLPKEGDVVDAVSREGEVVCSGRILSVCCGILRDHFRAFICIGSGLFVLDEVLFHFILCENSDFSLVQLINRD